MNRRIFTLWLSALALTAMLRAASADGIEFPKGSIYDYAARGELAQVKRLLAKNPKLAKANHPRYGTLTWCAAFGGHLPTVRHVVNRGSSVNAPCRGSSDATPLMLAAEVAEAGDPTVVAYLISKGANVNAVDNGGRTALHGAVMGGHPRIVRLLLSKGADAKPQDHSGYTALHLAAARDEVEIVQLLVEHGADVNSPGRQGTPLQIAIESKSSKAAGALRQLGAK